MKPLLSKEEIADLLSPLESEPAADEPGTTKQIHLEVGRIDISDQDFRQLNKGSVLSTAISANAPLDLYLNDTLVGRGECKQIQGKLTIMITELFTPEQ